jgi:hypothetical protein
MSLHTGLYVVFAPEERDVYSYERTPRDLAPLKAKLGSSTFVEAGKAIALLVSTERRSEGGTAGL